MYMSCHTVRKRSMYGLLLSTILNLISKCTAHLMLCAHGISSRSHERKIISGEAKLAIKVSLKQNTALVYWCFLRGMPHSPTWDGLNNASIVFFFQVGPIGNGSGNYCLK